MIFPESYEQKTGFDRLRTILHGYCLSDIGRSYVDHIEFQTSFPLVEKLLLQVNEFKQILEYNEGFPSSSYHDLRKELSRLQLSGTYIEVEHLVLLHDSLTTIFACRQYLEKRSAKFPILIKLGSLVEIDASLLTSITRIIDEQGTIRDTASEELRDLRKHIHRQKLAIDKSLASLLNEAKRLGYTHSDAEITIRSGRWVIPVIAQHKKRVRGIVHDESNTGQTLFIEPEQVFEETNYLLELQHAERREIVKILMKYSEQMRPDIPALLSAYRFLGLIDFIRAKARLAIDMHAVIPFLEDKPLLDWRDAVHPLLMFSLQKQNKTVIPNTLQLDDRNRIMIISGPNAGGKSVCLKTAGLLQYMLQCGLLIPVREDSKAGIFEHLFIDIGDQQSLDNDLSTYSSHLLSVKNLLAIADSSTLFLIDEFGSGTEPQTGGAIAESVLEILSTSGAKGIVTTHYSNLKLLAAKQTGLFNAAMMYDARQMQPLFKLRTGKPGSSFAFEIASTTGLEEQLLLRAAELAGKSQLDYDKELMQLDVEMESLRKKENEFRIADDLLDEVIQKYQKLTNELEGRKKDLLNDARIQAKAILDNANKLIEKTIQNIVEAQADKGKTRLIREDFLREKEKLTDETLSIQAEKVTPEVIPIPAPAMEFQHVKPSKPLAAGDRVKIAGNSMSGEILEIQGEELVIGFNSFTLKTSIHKVMRADGTETLLPKSSSSSASGTNRLSIHEKMANFQSTLDVRGKRAQEAVGMVKTYLDEAILLGVREVRVLHGTGTGVLRQVLREELRMIPEVKSAKDEKHELGGSGITIITLAD
jgi:DNA mismatch repair protein MutS2